MAKPLIGVTGPDDGGDIAWYCTRFMIWLAGGRALRITPARPSRADRLAGLVIGGGADIEPARYKQELLQTLKEESKKVRRWNLRFLAAIALWLLRRFVSIKSSRALKDPARDELEFGLLEECIKRKIPVMGICRGGQLINVFCGGSLHQSIRSFYTEQPQLRTIRARKKIEVEPGTTVARIVHRPSLLVNSLHDQSVDQLGAGLRVAAREPNGVVQAIEHRSLPFLIGVQWHPEFLPFHRSQRRFFRALVESARAVGA